MTIKIFKNLEIKIKHMTKTTIVVENLILEDEIIANNWLEIVDFLELFQSYIKNHLSFDVVYPFDLIEFKLHKSKTNEIFFTMTFKNNTYAFSKLNASRIVHKINRILARCNLLYHN